MERRGRLLISQPQLRRRHFGARVDEAVPYPADALTAGSEISVDQKIMRYQWLVCRPEGIDREELLELVDAWRMVVPKKLLALRR